MNTQDYKRRLTAIFSADVAGYSRLMREDEVATIKTLEAYKQVNFSLIKQHRGRVIDATGDNILAEFASVVDAVQCAVAVQNELKARNAELPENRKMQFRIGINLGDVIEEGDRIYGDGVNIAARLEALADPGGLCISKTAFDHIETKLPFGYEFLGDQEVKNIAKPIGAYRVLMNPRVTLAGVKSKPPKVSLWRHKLMLIGSVIVLLAIQCVVVWEFFLKPNSDRVIPINTAALKVEVINQDWDILPAGTQISYKGKQATLRQDLVHADFQLGVTNTSSKEILIPDWLLLDRNNNYLDPFRLMNNDGKNYIEEKLIINGNKTKLIFLRCTAKSLNELRAKEPLFITDINHTFIFEIDKIPPRDILLKKRQGAINE